MSKELPARPSLPHLKSQAKDLLAGYQARTSEALARFREALPAAHGKSDVALAAMNLALHDAQSVVAREYGFASWNELKEHVEKVRAAELTPEALRALLERQMGQPLPPEVERALLVAAADARAADLEPVGLDQPLPMIPTRNAMLTMGALAPFAIGRPTSIAAIEAAQRGAGTIVTFAQRDAANESPSADDLHPIGTAARLLAAVPTKGRSLWIVVRAARWVKLDALVQTTPHLVAQVTPQDPIEENDEEVVGLDRALRERVDELSAAMPGGDRIRAMTARMSPLELAEATVANLPVSVDEKARYAELPSLKARLRFLLALTSGSPTRV